MAGLSFLLCPKHIHIIYCLLYHIRIALHLYLLLIFVVSLSCRMRLKLGVGLLPLRVEALTYFIHSIIYMYVSSQQFKLLSNDISEVVIPTIGSSAAVGL